MEDVSPASKSYSLISCPYLSVARSKGSQQGTFCAIFLYDKPTLIYGQRLGYRMVRGSSLQGLLYSFHLSAVGPLIGGALAPSGAWRWLFYLNLPLCGIAIFFSSVFLQVRAPKAPLMEKLREMDWM